MKPDAEIASLDREKLELVNSILLSSVKSAQLEQVGLWVRLPESLQGEESDSVSRVGISLCVKLKRA